MSDNLAHLFALSPVDGRYANKVEALRPIMSEAGLLRQRLIVEVRWLEYLAKHSEIQEVPALSQSAQDFLENIIQNFQADDVVRIKTLEATTNHDVKAVEYFLKEKFSEHEELDKLKEFLHFACTSADINNLSYALMLKEARSAVLLPMLDELLEKLESLRLEHAAVPMLARTHGQPATPSTVGKEFAVIQSRLNRQRQQIAENKLLGKFNGATGNFNAHCIAYPELDWVVISEEFVTQLGLSWNALTTQIEPHDYIAELSHALTRANTVLIDLSRDVWGYISIGHFKQRTVAGEVGSSTMPHKVNPIDFENAEGNLTIANALLNCLASRLPVSRWQRCLVDSTLLRNLAPAWGHALIAYQALLKGLNKLALNEESIAADLASQPAVLAEAVQTVMRRYDLEAPYEQLKALTRGQALTLESLRTFIQEQPLPEQEKNELLAMKPKDYLGEAIKLAQRSISD